jgi:hypothetical protein
MARRVLVFGPEHARAEPPPGVLPLAVSKAASPDASAAVSSAAPSVASSVAPSIASSGAGGAAAVPELTLEQYASLCSEIAVFPQQADAIFQRYGLGSQRDRPSVDRAWRERLRRDPSLYRDWQDLYQRYQEYWTAQARRKPSR